MISLKKATVSAASLAAGVGLIATLLHKTGVDATMLAETLRRTDMFWASAVLLSTFLNLWLSAYKWKRVLRRLGERKRIPYMAYTSLGAVLGNFVPAQIAISTARGLGAKLGQRVSATKALGSSMLDQMYDLLPPICAFFLAIPIMHGSLDFTSGTLIFIGILAIAFVTLSLFQKRLIDIVVVTLYRLRSITHRFRKKDGAPSLTQVDSTQLNLREGLSLSALTFLRYANLFLRVYLVTLAVGIPLDLHVLFWAFPVVQLSMLVGITPGGAGIMEAGWIGVLSLFHVPTDASLLVALSLRLLALGCQIIIASSAWILLFSKKRRQHEMPPHPPLQRTKD
ncbi:lysylphosphatidylglycerol synthase transmembrane domain-containing protein [uncultured Pseudodesulfovibrio sp.]|uniref:lysylphosphatidylglycerol synthase transmembrane domain-containing protein n=1 Tax=uncultured Pseudodesulfovibrio sp. TaxID=2035858 RepID=UPI0029C88DA2|nr:lysylphosphatidylglycerol synthase transmembrane domain-containing protein [uncultured Pseudodesulfovibrio sp.]